MNVGGVQCYAPLCPVGAGEAIGGYVERLGGVRMAIARTGIKPVDPPKPPEPGWQAKAREAEERMARKASRWLSRHPELAAKARA